MLRLATSHQRPKFAHLFRLADFWEGFYIAAKGLLSGGFSVVARRSWGRTGSLQVAITAPSAQSRVRLNLQRPISAGFI
jgi:hypothetical protein